MRIVFVHNALESLAVEHLAALLKRAGHQVGLAFDPAIGSSFRYSNAWVAGLFSAEKQVVRKVVSMSPDLVCFSVYSDNYGWACAMARAIKQRLPVPILFGGVHPTLVPERVIRQENIDFVCVGDGEVSLLDLINALERQRMPSSFKNIWFKRGEEVVRSTGTAFVADASVFPAADKELFWQESPVFVQSVYTVVTGRHCLYACSYCHNSYLRSNYCGQYHQTRRQVDDVIAELARAKENYKIKRVSFFDELFISDRAWLEEFLRKYSEEIRLPFFCTVHPKLVDRQVVQMLKGAGCSSINMGVQTISERLRKDLLGRHETNDEIREAIRLITQANIFLFTNIIFGLPGQDEKEMEDIIQFFNENRPGFADSNWLRYYPKTTITRQAQARGFLTSQDIEDIEEGRVFKPYSTGGHTRNALNSKMRNLLSCVVLLPRSWVSWGLRHKAYRYFPLIDLRGSAVLAAMMSQKMFSGIKHPYPHLSVKDIICFHLIYAWRTCRDRLFHQ